MHVSARLDQLVCQPFDADKTQARSIPAEDIGLLLVDHPQVTFTHAAFQTLLHHGAAILICGRDHLPAGMLLPLSGNSQIVQRLNEQINASKPTLKQLWRQVVQAKVRAQARNLDSSSHARKLLLNMVDEVKSGDTSNIEGQAARVYWNDWLAPEHQPRLASSLTAGTGYIDLDAAKSFRRDPDGLDILNVMLNYGYAVLRAAMGRAIVAAGLTPALGLHHHHRANAFCLADDLIEPLRPMVDRRVRRLHRQGRPASGQLDQPTKANLLSVLTDTVQLDGDSGPLMVSLHRMVASLIRALRGETKALSIPVPVED